MTSPYSPYVAAGPVSTTPTLVSPGVSHLPPGNHNNFSSLEGGYTLADQPQTFGASESSLTQELYPPQPHLQTYNRSPDHIHNYVYRDTSSQNPTHYQSSPHNDYSSHRQFSPNQFRPQIHSPPHQLPPHNYPEPPSLFDESRRHDHLPHQITPQNYSQLPNTFTSQYPFHPVVHNLNRSVYTLPVIQTPPRQEIHKTLENTGYCILSLDGGGIRGLSTLYILQQIMARLNLEREKASLPPKKPCEIFDLIAGTSTGGLIAIMLGHLEMTVEECIEAYNDMMRHVFERRKNRSIVSILGKVQPRFSSTALKEAISKVITEQGLDPNEKLYNKERYKERGKSRRCKVFVTTKTQEMSSITRLRNYLSLISSQLQPTILEAALATSAAPTYFTPISIDGTYFLDGALGANNPCDELEAEASNLWCETTGRIEPLIKCYISVGSGHTGTRHVSDKGLKYFLETLQKEATETKKTTSRWESRWREGVANGKCYRFNVEHGLEGVGLAEYQQAADVRAASLSFLEEIETIGKVRTCVQNLRMKEYEPTPAFVEKLKTQAQSEESKPSQPLETATSSEIGELIARGKSLLRKSPSTQTTKDLELARHYFINAQELSRQDRSTTPKFTARLCQNLLDTSLRLSMKSRKPKDRKDSLDHARQYGQIALSNTIQCGDQWMEAQVRFSLACVEAWAVCLDASERREAPGHHPRKRDVEVRMRERLEDLRRFEGLQMGIFEGQVEKFEGFLNRRPRTAAD